MYLIDFMKNMLTRIKHQMALHRIGKEYDKILYYRSTKKHKKGFVWSTTSIVIILIQNQVYKPV